MGNLGNGMALGLGNALGAYTRSEEADSNRPVTQNGLLESLGIYSPAQKQAMQVAQQHADDIAQNEQDMQEAQLSTGLAGPAFYGIRAGRQLGKGLGGLLAGNPDPYGAQQQPQQDPNDPYAIVAASLRDAKDPEDAYQKILGAAKVMQQKGDPRGYALQQKVMMEKAKLDEARASIEEKQAQAGNANASAIKTGQEVTGTTPIKNGEQLHGTDEQGRAVTKYWDASQGKYVTELAGIPASKVTQTSVDGNPMKPTQASEDFSKFTSNLSGAKQSLDIINEMMDNYHQSPGSLGLSGKAALFLENLSANTNNIVNFAETLGKKVDQSVIDGFANPMDHYAKELSAAGIGKAKDQQNAITLAYMLAASQQKSASISDKDIAFYLQRIGSNLTSIPARDAVMEQLKDQIMGSVTGDADSKFTAGDPKHPSTTFRGVGGIQKLMDEIGTTAYGKSYVPPGQTFTDPSTGQVWVSKGGRRGNKTTWKKQ